MFFIISKIIGFFIYPLHLIGSLFLVFWVFKGSKIKSLRRVSFTALFFSLFLILIGGSSYISNLIIWKLETMVPMIVPEKTNGIILLGGSFTSSNKSLELNQVALNGAAERAVETLSLLNYFPESELLFFANSGVLFPNGPSEAEEAERFFSKFKIDKSRLTIHARANNTYQESKLISEYLKNKRGNWILVTSASHMPRAMSLFQSRKILNINIFPYPVDFNSERPEFNLNFHLKNLGTFYIILHEYIGIIAYRLTGRTNKLFPDIELIPITSDIN